MEIRMISISVASLIAATLGLIILAESTSLPRAYGSITADEGSDDLFYVLSHRNDGRYYGRPSYWRGSYGNTRSPECNKDADARLCCRFWDPFHGKRTETHCVQ